MWHLQYSTGCTLGTLIKISLEIFFSYLSLFNPQTEVIQVNQNAILGFCDAKVTVHAFWSKQILRNVALRLIQNLMWNMN